MHSVHRPRVAALVFAVALALGACGGAAGPANDPAGTVQAAYAAVTSGGVSKIGDYVCAAKKGDLAGLFGGANPAPLTAAGAHPDPPLPAGSVSFSRLQGAPTAE